MKKTISITGSKGNIGTVLASRLKGEYDIKSLDLPEVDLLDKERVLEILKGSDAVIHLAWDTRENCISGIRLEENMKMYKNILESCVKLKIPRLIFASSVHVNNCRNTTQFKRYSLFSTPDPVSPYGEDKVLMEELAEQYADKIEIVAVRFGGIEKTDYRFWHEDHGLTHDDCTGLIRHVLELENIPNRFQVVYGLSRYDKSVFDISNDIGWTPKDDLTEFYEK